MAGTRGGRRSASEADGRCGCSLAVYLGSYWWHEVLFPGVHMSNKEEQLHSVLYKDGGAT